MEKKIQITEGKTIHYGMMSYDEIVVLLQIDLLDENYCRYCDTESKDYVENIRNNGVKVNVKLRIDYSYTYYTNNWEPVLFLNDVSISFFLYEKWGWYNSLFYRFFDIITKDRERTKELDLQKQKQKDEETNIFGEEFEKSIMKSSLL